MQKTFENTAKIVGFFTLCAIASANWQLVAGTFNIAGGLVRGAGNIMLMVVGGKPAGNTSPAFYSGNIGDDGSGDGLQDLTQYSEGK